MQEEDIAWPCKGTLPHLLKFPLPQPVKCRANCGDVYCCQECEESSWSASHSVLCCGAIAPRNVQGGQERIDALKKFKSHAEENNCHLLLAAQVVATVILNAQNQIGKTEGEDAAWAALIHGFEPFRMGWRQPWWECATQDEGTQTGMGYTEDKFKSAVREMGNESLSRLIEAFDLEFQQFPALFSLDVWGDILGMFDLNNLSIRVWNPANSYLEFLANLQEPEFCQAMEQAAPILEVLQDAADGSVHCEGTGFFMLQSLLNHSCDPNAASIKTQDEHTGVAVIAAVKTIEPGEEITIDYMDVKELPVAERQEVLFQQYHFQCRCARCILELTHETCSDLPC